MKLLRELPRWVAITVWAVGFLVVLGGEMLAVVSVTEGDTISEVVWEITGVGEPINLLFLVSRIILYGLLSWLLLHFSSKGRV